MGDIVRALSMLQQATALAPETPLYWSNLALVSNFAGDLHAASDAWRRATSLYPLTQAPQDCMWEFLPASWSGSRASRQVIRTARRAKCTVGQMDERFSLLTFLFVV